MRRLFNKLIKKEVKIQQGLDFGILKSDDYQALVCMNYIMNLYDEIEKINKARFNPLDGEDLYLEARFSANNFLSTLFKQVETAEGNLHATDDTKV